MARKGNLANKLDGGTTRPGWKDRIVSTQHQPDIPVADQQPATTSKRKAKKNKLIRKTYLLSPDLIADIESLANQENVGINELVRFLLSEAIAQVDHKMLDVPTKPAKRQIVD